MHSAGVDGASMPPVSALGVNLGQKNVPHTCHQQMPEPLQKLHTPIDKGDQGLCMNPHLTHSQTAECLQCYLLLRSQVTQSKV